MQRRRDDLVAVADPDDREADHQKRHEPRDPQRPGQRHVLDHPARAQRENDPSDPGPGRGDPVGQTAPLAEPLRQDRHARDVDAPDPDPDQGALREVELPRSHGEGGRDEAARQAEYAEDHGRPRSILVCQVGDQRRHQHGSGEVEAADEGEVEGGGAGEGVGAEVIGEVYSIGLEMAVRLGRLGQGVLVGDMWVGTHCDESPCETVDDEACRHTNPAVAPVDGRGSGMMVGCSNPRDRMHRTGEHHLRRQLMAETKNKVRGLV